MELSSCENHWVTVVPGHCEVVGMRWGGEGRVGAVLVHGLKSPWLHDFDQTRFQSSLNHTNVRNDAFLEK